MKGLYVILESICRIGSTERVPFVKRIEEGKGAMSEGRAFRTVEQPVQMSGVGSMPGCVKNQGGQGGWNSEQEGEQHTWKSEEVTWCQIVRHLQAF